jgi:hypothetical protein
VAITGNSGNNSTAKAHRHQQELFAQSFITLVVLCQTAETADKLVRINGWARIKGFPSLCKNSPPFCGW